MECFLYNIQVKLNSEEGTDSEYDESTCWLANACGLPPVCSIDFILCASPFCGCQVSYTCICIVCSHQEQSAYFIIRPRASSQFDAPYQSSVLSRMWCKGRGSAFHSNQTNVSICGVAWYSGATPQSPLFYSY